jgi:hypothetical protein
MTCWTGQKQTLQLADMCGSVTHQNLVPWHGVGNPVANRLPSGATPHCQQAIRGEAYQNCRQRDAPSTAACPEPCGGLLCPSAASGRQPYTGRILCHGERHWSLWCVIEVRGVDITTGSDVHCEWKSTYHMYLDLYSLCLGRAGAKSIPIGARRGAVRIAGRVRRDGFLGRAAAGSRWALQREAAVGAAGASLTCKQHSRRTHSLITNLHECRAAYHPTKAKKLIFRL